MSQPNSKQEIALGIESLSYGSYGVARINNQVVLIPGTAPGDKVAARIVENKPRYAIGEIIRVLEPSSNRRLAPCPYVAECGGCPWQQVRYEAQLRAKEKNIEDALKRIGKLSGFELRPIIPSPSEFGYRRRIRLQVDQSRRLGFYRAGSHRLVEIESCVVATNKASECIPQLRRWVGNLVTPIESIEIVTGDEPSAVVIVADSPGAFSFGDEPACGGLIREKPYIRGLILRGRDWRQTWGDPTIFLHTGDSIRLVMEADVFTQIHPDGNRRIVSEILKAGAFNPDDRVLELYSGGGNFTLSIAKRAREVVAVEAYRNAVESGKLNAELNGLFTIRWVNASAPAALQRLAREHEKFTKIVLDPPRTGAKEIAHQLAALGADRVLYVSCNPATFARDAAALSSYGYKLAVVQPIDLFPQTFHVELIATITRRA